MLTTDLFALIVAMLSTGAVGATILYEFSRISLLNGRHALVRMRLRDRSVELDRLRDVMADAERAVQQQQAVLDGLLAERARLTAQIKSAEEAKIELLHEFGDQSSSSGQFLSDLTPTAELPRLDQRRIIFAREIWTHRNRAHIWADSREEAIAMLRRVFHERTGVQPGPVYPIQAAEAGTPDDAAPAGKV
jgi:hypothetical protein